MPDQAATISSFDGFVDRIDVLDEKPSHSCGAKRIKNNCPGAFSGSVATFRFCQKTPRFRDFAEKPAIDFEALRQCGVRAKPGFFGRIKSLQHFLNYRVWI